jgi:hypothetical protein
MNARKEDLFGVESYQEQDGYICYSYQITKKI